jgi:tetratricopeptide (TPR) repeat protein
MYYKQSRCETKKRTLADGDKEGAAFLNREVSGTISSDATWCSGGPDAQIHVIGNVTIASGVTLTIRRGVIVKFWPGVSLTVNGTLNAIGTSSSRITFTGNGSTWAGLIFNGGGGTVQYAHISNATYGILFQNSGPDPVENTEIDYCTWGIYTLGTGGDYKHFTNNSVHNNYYGFLFNNAIAPSVQGNTISANTIGVQPWGSSADPVLSQNTIENNTVAGLYPYNAGWAELMNNASNTLRLNSRGVYCEQYAGAALGTMSLPGYNKLRNTNFDVYADNTCPDIYAIQNCWQNGVPDPGKIFHDGTGQIYYTPYWNCGGVGKVAAGGMIPLLRNTSTDDSAAVELDRRGQALMAEEKYQEAAGEFQFVLENYPATEVAKSSLHSLWRSYRELGRVQDGLVYVSSVAQRHQAIELGGYALKLTLPELVREGRYEEALGRSQGIRSRFPKTALDKVLLYEEGVLYRYFFNDRAKASESFQKLIEQYPDGLVADLARLELGLAPKGFGKETEPQRRTRSNLVLPQAYVLEQNYPNPFNPATEIRFGVPRQSVVKLEVFNVLGQVVKILVDEVKEAGYYRVMWDGRNSDSVPVPSGMYLYRLSALDTRHSSMFVESRKMLFIK